MTEANNSMLLYRRPWLGLCNLTLADVNLHSFLEHAAAIKEPIKIYAFFLHFTTVIKARTNALNAFTVFATKFRKVEPNSVLH